MLLQLLQLVNADQSTSNATSMTPSTSPSVSLSPSTIVIDAGVSASPSLVDGESSTSPSDGSEPFPDNESQNPSLSPSTFDGGDEIPTVSSSPSAAPSSDDNNMLVPTFSLAPTSPSDSTEAPSLSLQPSTAGVDAVPTMSLQPSIDSMQPQMNTQFPHHSMAPHHTFPPHHSRTPSTHNGGKFGEGEDSFDSLKLPAFILAGVVILSAAFCIAQRVKRYRQFHGVQENADMNWDLELSTYQPGLS